MLYLPLSLTEMTYELLELELLGVAYNRELISSGI
jgi:hypothetical protein